MPSWTENCRRPARRRARLRVEVLEPRCVPTATVFQEAEPAAVPLPHTDDSVGTAQVLNTAGLSQFAIEGTLGVTSEDIDQDYYAVQLHAGQVQFTTSVTDGLGHSFTPQTNLLDAHGNFVGYSQDSPTGPATADLPSSGTYYLFVNVNGSLAAAGTADFASYKISVSAVSGVRLSVQAANSNTAAPT